MKLVILVNVTMGGQGTVVFFILGDTNLAAVTLNMIQNIHANVDTVSVWLYWAIKRLR